ncbi:MAG: metallopeptidase family protein [Phycisphaerales bacterium]|nr:metallopeptidase family protein [Phycisphaerales bacterium]
MIRMSEAEFAGAAEHAVASIPPHLRRYLRNVLIEVRDRPTPDLLVDDLADVPPDELLGMYVGRSIEEPDVGGSSTPLPDRVLIFRENLCAMCDSREELLEEIRVTVLHEIGHHFGMDEADLEELGYD